MLKAFFTRDDETSSPQIMQEWLLCLLFFFLDIFVWIAAGVTCIGYLNKKVKEMVLFPYCDKHCEEICLFVQKIDF